MRRTLIASAILSVLLAAPVLALDLDDVFRMLEADVGEEVILRVIDTEQARFYLTTDDIIDLQYAGASDWFLEEILDRSTRPPRQTRTTRYGYDPYAAYTTIGLAYDPFDYYFVTWPYYYAYVSPFRFGWTWWYYGGPYHEHWCNSWGYRTDYYDHAWGSRTIWSRGYRDRVYRVPRYDASEKQMQRAAYSRAGLSRGKTARSDGRRQRAVSSRTAGERRIYDRSGRYTRDASTKRSDRSTRVSRSTRSMRPTRQSPTWGRTSKGNRGSAPRRSSVGSRKPSRTNPSKARPTHPSSRSGSSKSPSRPSRGDKRSR